MIMDAKEEIMNVMVTVRFFELQNKMITTTDKTEIEIEAHVIKYILYYTYIYITQFFFFFFKLQKYNFLLIILKKTKILYNFRICVK